MQFVCYPLSLWFILVYTCSEKPSFLPFCLTRNLCKSACECASAPNCTILEMNDDIRQKITFYMNEIREMQMKGEPRPSGLTMLEYDRQLEEISSCWAVRSENEYSECFYTPRFSETSQNVGVSRRNEYNLNLWYEVISLWLGEIKILNVQILHNLPAGEEALKIHNFAQLLSEKVFYVGCSWSSSPQWVLLVCTFGPRGPLQGQPIYKTGKPCSSCPSGYECDYQKPFEWLCKRNYQRSSFRRILPMPKRIISSKNFNEISRRSKKETTMGNNLNHPWAGIYIFLLFLLIMLIILFVLGSAFYCICFF